MHTFSGHLACCLSSILLKKQYPYPKTPQVYNYIGVPHRSVAFDYQTQVYGVVRVFGIELFKILHTLCGKSPKRIRERITLKKRYNSMFFALISIN